MTVLENPRANAGLAHILVRALVAAGGTGSVDSILRSVCPPGVGNFSELRDGDAREETIQVCTALKLLVHDPASGVLELAIDEATWEEVQPTAGFRCLVRQRLMEEASVADAFSPGIGAFGGAIAWLLAQDPLRPIEGWGGRSGKGENPEQLQLRNLGHNNRLISNPTQWAAFVRWATFLGFLVRIRLGQRPGQDLFAADPAGAVKDALTSAEPVPAQRFLAALSVDLPVVDDGTIRKQVESRWLGESPPSAVSPALSAALLRLEAQGALNLLNVSDAPAEDRAVLHLGTEHRIVSAVAVNPNHE